MKLAFFVSILLVALIPSAIALSVVDVAPAGFAFTPADVSRDAAQDALDQSVILIDELELHGYGIIYVTDAYDEAQLSFAHDDYLSVITIGQLIRHVHDLAFLLHDQLELFGREIESPRESGVDVSRSLSTFTEAVMALEKEQYDDALSLFEQSREQLEQEQTESNRVNLIERFRENFFVRYQWHLLLFFAVIAGMSYPLFWRVRKKLMRKRLLHLKSDLEQTQELIRRLQKRCFVEKKMTTQTYKLKAAQYEEHIAELKHTIPVVEAQLSGKKSLIKHGVLEVLP